MPDQKALHFLEQLLDDSFSFLRKYLASVQASFEVFLKIIVSKNVGALLFSFQPHGSMRTISFVASYSSV